MLRVSKEWTAAVNSMHPVDVELPYLEDDSRLLRFCMSPLSRHVSKANVWMFPLSCWSLCHLKLRLPSLQQLSCRFEGSWLPLMFPARLRNLTVRFLAAAAVTAPFSDKQHRELDEAIVAIASLPLLEELDLSVSMARRCCLTPLATAPILRTLNLRFPSAVFDSPTVIEALRAMPLLRSLNFDPSAKSFTRMLQPPHTMKLEKLYIDEHFTTEFGEAIVHLPTLTNLSVWLNSPHTDFFCQLPNLRCLEMNVVLTDVPPETDRIMQSLQSLTALTELEIEEAGDFPLRFTSDQLAACLAHMPLLTRLDLTIAKALDSLRFLSSGPITRSLTKLHLSRFEPRLPLRELHHVHELSALTDLGLYSVFDRPLDDYSASLYSPPSRLMPSLVRFNHGWKPAEGEE
jgi:hypothetical protein